MNKKHFFTTVRVVAIATEMLCTLQEAYSIPSFDPASTSCPKPSDPAYGPNKGREAASFEKRAASVERREGFRNIDPEKAPSYKALAGDVKYYCDSYGICPSTMPSVTEHFTTSESPSYGSYAVYDTAAPAKVPSKKSKRSMQSASKPPKCTGPLEPPMYEIPISDEAKKQYNVAFNTAISQDQKATAAYTSEPRHADMSQVTGFVDEELDSYLQTSDMKAAPMLTSSLPKTKLNAEPYDPEASPFARAYERYSRQPMGSDTVRERMTTASQPRDKSSMWLDILLFSLIGLLLIALCDQLVRLGIMLGMRSTVDALLPLIEKLEKLEAK